MRPPYARPFGFISCRCAPTIRVRPLSLSGPLTTSPSASGTPHVGFSSTTSHGPLRGPRNPHWPFDQLRTSPLAGPSPAVTCLPAPARAAHSRPLLAASSAPPRDVTSAPPAPAHGPHLARAPSTGTRSYSPMGGRDHPAPTPARHGPDPNTRRLATRMPHLAALPPVGPSTLATRLGPPGLTRARGPQGAQPISHSATRPSLSCQSLSCP